MLRRASGCSVFYFSAEISVIRPINEYLAFVFCQMCFTSKASAGILDKLAMLFRFY